MRAYACLASQERIRENEALRVAGHLRCRRQRPCSGPQIASVAASAASRHYLVAAGLAAWKALRGERRYALGSNQHYQLSLLWG